MDPGMFRLLSMFYIHWRYFLLLLWPFPLSCDYSLNCIPMIQTSDDNRIIEALAFYLFLVSSAVLGFQRYFEKPQKSKKKVVVNPEIKARWLVYLFAWAIIIISFFPSSNFLVFVGTLIGERLLYFPSIGFSILFAWIWWHIYQTPYAIKHLASLIFITWIVWQCTVTVNRNVDWRNEEALFRAAETVCGESAKVQEVSTNFFDSYLS